MSDVGALTTAEIRLADVCRAAVVALDASGAAAILFGAAGPTLALATDATATALEREQQLCGEGPSLSAFAVQVPLVVDDLTGASAQQRWPALCPSLVGWEVGRFVALPMGVGDIRIGVLAIYSRAIGTLSGAQLPAALLAADGAALAMLDGELGPPDALPVSGFDPVLDYRIHQATGMVMAQTGLGALDALASLRARAFSANVPLARVASDVIGGRARLDAEDG